jgi:hypothetical protein
VPLVNFIIILVKEYNMFGVKGFFPKSVSVNVNTNYRINYVDKGRSYFVITDACINIRKNYDIDNETYTRTDQQLSILLCKAAITACGVGAECSAAHLDELADAIYGYIKSILTNSQAPCAISSDVNHNAILGVPTKPWIIRTLYILVNSMAESLKIMAK